MTNPSFPRQNPSRKSQEAAIHIIHSNIVWEFVVDTHLCLSTATFHTIMEQKRINNASVEGQDSPDSLGIGVFGENLFPLASIPGSPTPDRYLCEIDKVSLTPAESWDSWLKEESHPVSSQPCPTDSLIPLLPVPAEFFHPSIPTTDSDPEDQTLKKSLPKLSPPDSWATLRSPDVNCALLRQTTESNSSIESGSPTSEDSLQTTLEDSLNLSDSPQCTLDLPDLRVAPTSHRTTLPISSLSMVQRRSNRPNFALQKIRRHQRSHSSGGSTSPGCTLHDSMDPSDEEGAGGSLRGTSEPSETFSSLSLTSLFSPPPSLTPPGGVMKKCSSVNSLSVASSRVRGAKQFYAVDPQGFLSMPSWVMDFYQTSTPSETQESCSSSSKLPATERGIPTSSVSGNVDFGNNSRRNR